VIETAAGQVRGASTRPGVFRSCGHSSPPGCPDRPCPRGRERDCRLNDQIAQCEDGPVHHKPRIGAVTNQLRCLYAYDRSAWL
jgi:hypothetical protein